MSWRFSVSSPLRNPCRTTSAISRMRFRLALSDRSVLSDQETSAPIARLREISSRYETNPESESTAFWIRRPLFRIRLRRRRRCLSLVLRSALLREKVVKACRGRGDFPVDIAIHFAAAIIADRPAMMFTCRPVDGSFFDGKYCANLASSCSCCEERWRNHAESTARATILSLPFTGGSTRSP